jgi:hypothetical protein
MEGRSTMEEVVEELKQVKRRLDKKIATKHSYPCCDEFLVIIN